MIKAMKRSSSQKRTQKETKEKTRPQKPIGDKALRQLMEPKMLMRLPRTPAQLSNRRDGQTTERKSLKMTTLRKNGSRNK